MQRHALLSATAWQILDLATDSKMRPHKPMLTEWVGALSLSLSLSLLAPSEPKNLPQHQIQTTA